MQVPYDPLQYSPSAPRKCLDSKSLLYKFIYTPAILHIHLLFTNPNPVFRLQVEPLQYWHPELHVNGVALHWPLRHVSPRVHLSPSSHATPSRFVQVLVLLLGLHHLKLDGNQKVIRLVVSKYLWCLFPK